MDRDELAERVVDLMYRMSLIKKAPSWPALPLIYDANIFDKLIQANVDPWILRTPVVVLHEWVDEEDKTDRTLSIIRTSIAPKKVARRFLKRNSLGSPMLRYEWYLIEDGNIAKQCGDFVFGHIRGNWTPVGDLLAKYRVNHRTGDWLEEGGLLRPEMENAFYVAPGARIMMEASWLARLRVTDNTPAVELPTDSEGIYALFKDRDCHGTRKKALLHWVKSHYRTMNEKCVPVSEHLRGVFSFEWYGVNVGLTPPADSMERALQGKKVAPSVLKALERYYKGLEDYEVSKKAIVDKVKFFLVGSEGDFSDRNKTRIEKQACPYCGVQMDTLGDVPSSSEGEKPKPLDLAVCISCGGVQIIGEDVSLEKLSKDKMEELRKEHPKVYFSIKKVQRGLKKLRNRK